MLGRSCRVAVPALAVIAVLSGNWDDTPTGIELNRLPRFPLTKIRSGHLTDGAQVNFDGITAAAELRGTREVRLAGVGKSGKRWEAHLAALDEVWRGDLDANGTQDYVLFSSGPYFNGRITPLYSLSILLMDTDRLPVPFFTVVYRGANGDGIKNLLDLTRDGHAELLISSYDENTSDPLVGPFCSGHWAHQLYRFRDGAAEELRGTIAGMRFPLIHAWSYRATCPKAEQPFLPLRPATLHEHGTSARDQVVTSVRTPSDGKGVFGVYPAAGCNSVEPRAAVYDRPQVREIAFPNPFSEYMATLTDRIRRAQARVELRGIDRSMGQGECSVNLLWAH